MIIAIVVTYEPSFVMLHKVLGALAEQVSDVVVVDNGSRCANDIKPLVRNFGALLVALPSNEGIASAQNRGIEIALKAGASDVLLMDQDTILHAGAVNALVATRRKLADKGIRVGSIGPLYRNSHDGRPSTIWRADGRSLVRSDPGYGSGNWVEADFVIASGSLLSAETLRVVGTMDEPLFIDLVDLEWGFRAAAMGYRHFVCCEAQMNHTLGAGQLRFFRRTVTRHAPIRNYYWVRNALTLSRRGYVRCAWKRYFILQALRFPVFYSLFADQKLKRLRLMLVGLTDAIRGRGGSFDRH